MAVGSPKKLRIAATFADIRLLDAFVVDYMRQSCGSPDSVVQEVELAVHEIGCNIVEHAYAGREDGEIQATISCSSLPRPVLVVQLSDHGLSFEPETVSPVDLATPHEGGYGLFLAHTLLDEVQYERRGSENRWLLKKVL